MENRDGKIDGRTFRVFVQLELAFKEQLETEERARLAEKERLERERLEARKQREVQRITDVSVSGRL